MYYKHIMQRLKPNFKQNKGYTLSNYKCYSYLNVKYNI